MPIGTAWTGHKANFISPKGNYGIVPSSELAMSTRIADMPVVQFALFSDKKRWPHVTWAHVMTPDGFVTDGLPSEVLPAEVRRTLGGFGNEKMPKGASQRQEYVANPRASDDNPKKVHAMMVRAFLDGRKASAGSRYKTDGKTLWVWGNVVAAKQADGIMLRDAGWRTLLTKNVLNELLSQMGIPGSIVQRNHVWMLGVARWPGSVVAPYKTLPKPVNGTATNPIGRDPLARQRAAHKRRVLAQIAAHKKSLKKHPMVTVGRFRNWKSLRKGMRSLQDDAGIWTAQAWRKKGQSWKVDVRSYHKTAARRALRGLARGNPVVDLTIRKTFQGALSISAIVGGYRVERQYMGYTKREAIAMFRSYIKTMKRNPLTRKESARVLREARHHERLSGFYSKGIAKGLTRAVEIAGPKKASRAAGILGMRAAGFRPEEYRKYYPNPRTVQLLSDDIDRHGAGCDCGLCNSTGKSYGVGIFPGSGDPRSSDPLDRIYGPSEESAMAQARQVCAKKGWKIVRGHERNACPNPRSCKMCGGPLVKMGGLGNLMWYRCRNCGMETSVKK